MAAIDQDDVRANTPIALRAVHLTERRTVLGYRRDRASWCTAPSDHPAIDCDHRSRDIGGAIRCQECHHSGYLVRSRGSTVRHLLVVLLPPRVAVLHGHLFFFNASQVAHSLRIDRSRVNAAYTYAVANTCTAQADRKVDQGRIAGPAANIAGVGGEPSDATTLMITPRARRHISSYRCG